MTTYRIHNGRSGQNLGLYVGETEEHAIAAMYRDAGYQAEVVDGEIVGDEGDIDGLENIVAVEVTPSITVTHTISRQSIGDASASDEDWQETVRAACESEIETELARLYPGADVTVAVEVAAQDSLRVDLDTPDAPRMYETVLRQVREASQRGFDRACGE